MKKLLAIARRVREPSTWAGISVLLVLVGLPAPLVGALGGLLDLAPELLDKGAAVGAAVASMLLAEKGEA